MQMNTIPTRSLLAIAALLLSIAISPAISPVWAAEPDDALVKRVHANALTLDAHIDILDNFDAQRAASDTQEQFDLPKLERGQLDVATVALFASPAKTTPENIASARKQIDTKLQGLRQLVAQHPDKLEFAKSSADLERIAGSGKHAILLSFLNALPLGNDLTLLPRYYDDGVRVFGFVHASNNAFADSSRPNAAFGDKPNASGGLTVLGKQAVAELNRLGIVIDVSQLTPAATLQTVQLSNTPVIASHSGLRSRVDVPRNLSDEELRAIAARGGVVHIVAFASYLKDDPKRREDYQKNIWQAFGLKQGVDDPKTKLDAATYEKYQAAYRNYSASSWRYASVADYVDSIDAAVKLIGVDHVGISSDFNHGGGVTGFANVGDAPNVTRELLRRGYTEAQIKQLWGGNFIRVLKGAEQSARQLQSSLAPRTGA
jgi:membrane dipeptidase